MEGQPALGKSSLVSWLSWNTLHQTATAQELLDERKLLVIRMRDLLSETDGYFNVQAPMYTILKYLYRNKLDPDVLKTKYEHDAPGLFENSALILDGFDELCMVEDIQRDAGTILFKNMYHELQKWHCNCKVLITSRPNYINMSQLEFPFMYIELQPFDAVKRIEWLARYSEKCPIKRELSELIGQEQSSHMEFLLQIPLVLYMICAKNTVIGKNENRWHLYYTIFHEEVYKRSYENLDEHITTSYRDNLYLLTAGIAYALCEQRHFFISVEKLLEKKNIREIIDKMDIRDSSGELSVKKLKDILENCVALTSYFSIRNSNANGHLGKQIVEFCHNNIKDFFCCEYLWQNMQKLYEHIPENGKINYFMSFFQNLFQYTPFMKDDSSTGKKNVAVSFLCEKVEYYKQCEIQEEFILAELENRYFQKFFGKMLETGVVYDYKCDGENNLLDMIANIYCSILPIYKAIYMPYLTKDQRMELADSSSQRINIGTSFIYEIIFRLANCHDHTFLKFDDILFSLLTFPDWDFSHSSFCNCLMRYTNFGKSNLQAVDFSGANLDYSDFRKATINSKTCFAGCSCKMTKVTRTQAPFFEKYNMNDLDIYD